MQAVTANAYSDEVAALIPPFPRSGKIKYRLLEHGGMADEVNSRDEVIPNRRLLGQPTILTAQQLIFDPTLQDNVLINISKSRRLQGQGASQQLAEVLEYITFDEMGELSLSPQQMPQYRFMELHPRNRTNVLTGINTQNPQLPDRGWLFERIEPEKTARELAETQRMVDKIRAIIGDNTAAENLAIAKRLPKHFGIDASQDENGIYSQLRAAAEKDPETVLMATTDNATKVEALITEALANKLLEFSHESRQYVDGTTRKPVLTVPAGEPKDTLRDWLLDTQGAPTRKALQKQLADLKNVPAANKLPPRGTPFQKKSEPRPEVTFEGPAALADSSFAKQDGQE